MSHLMLAHKKSHENKMSWVISSQDITDVYRTNVILDKSLVHVNINVIIFNIASFMFNMTEEQRTLTAKCLIIVNV